MESQPRRISPVMLLGFVMVIAGILLIVIPFFIRPGVIGGGNNNIIEEAGGIANSILMQIGGGFLVAFGMMVVVFSGVAKFVGGIFNSILHPRGIMDQLLNKNKSPFVTCSSCAAKNEREAKVCRYCGNPI